MAKLEMFAQADSETFKLNICSRLSSCLAQAGHRLTAVTRPEQPSLVAKK